MGETTSKTMMIKKSIEDTCRILDKANKDILMACAPLLEGIDSIETRIDTSSPNGLERWVSIRRIRMQVNEVKKRCISRMKF